MSRATSKLVCPLIGNFFLIPTSKRVNQGVRSTVCRGAQSPARIWRQSALFAGAIVPPERVRQMTAPVSDVPEERRRYGLGFWLAATGDAVMLEGYDAGVSFRSLHDPATDTGNALELGAIGLTNDTETLQLLEDTIKGALAAMRLAVKDKQPELVSVLRRFDISRKSDSITVEGSIPAEMLKDMMNKAKAKAATAVGSK